MDRYYVDYKYRDIYYTHYSSKHYSIERNTYRLFLFNDEIIMNESIAENMSSEELSRYLVAAMIVEPKLVLGRTYINPKYILGESYYVRTVRYKFTFEGKIIKLFMKGLENCFN